MIVGGLCHYTHEAILSIWKKHETKMILLLVGNILSQHTLWNRIFFCRLSSIPKARMKKITARIGKSFTQEALFPLVHDTHISLTKTRRPKDNFGNFQLHLPWYPNCPWTLLHLVQRAIVNVARRLMKYDQRNQVSLTTFFKLSSKSTQFEFAHFWSQSTSTFHWPFCCSQHQTS